MRVSVIFLCIEQDAQHLLILEEVYRLGHQARSDTPAPERWMNSDPHEVASFAVQRIKLVSYYLALQFRHHEIRVRVGNITEGNSVVAPQVLEAFFLDNQQCGYIAMLERANRHLLVPFTWHAVVI